MTQSNALRAPSMLDSAESLTTVQADVDAGNVNSWLEEHADDMRQLIQRHGALLIRGIELHGSKKLARALTRIFGSPLLEYSNRSTPRTKKRGLVYTSTEYHPDETIPQHNENAYSNSWPMLIGFYCVQPSAEGGATPIADSRLVYDGIDPDVRNEFEQRNLRYVRNYGELDLPWSEVFQTSNRDEVERYCHANAIEFEWLPNDGLRTSQQCASVVNHPRTDEKLWFNQAHLFHLSNLTDDHRENLLRLYKAEQLPRNVYFGDGSEIDPQMLDHIRSVYQAQKISFPWRAYDLMLLDNMLFSHGREPFQGERSVLVGMADSYSLNEANHS